jgi:hypothetical protein
MKTNSTHINRCIVITIAVIVAAAACKQSALTENVDSDPSPVTLSSDEPSINPIMGFHRTVGGPIPKETSKRWIENYKRRHGNVFSYQFPLAVLMESLGDAGAEGILMNYATDQDGRRHVVAIAVDGNGKVIRTRFVYMSNGFVPWDEAVNMVKSYTGTPRGHFFGANTFQRLSSKGATNDILATSAIDENNAYQLILSVANPDDDDDDDDDEDKTYPCPPVCPTNLD